MNTSFNLGGNFARNFMGGANKSPISSGAKDGTFASIMNTETTGTVASNAPETNGSVAFVQGESGPAPSSGAETAGSVAFTGSDSSGGSVASVFTGGGGSCDSGGGGGGLNFSA